MAVMHAIREVMVTAISSVPIRIMVVAIAAEVRRGIAAHIRAERSNHGAPSFFVYQLASMVRICAENKTV